MRYLLIFAITASAWATTSVVGVQVSNTQALVHVSTNQGGNCTYRISESNTYSPLVYDVNATLFSGANSDARTGSIISGSDHWFLAGTRTSAKGSDGKFYSRALAAFTSHYGGVTCGTDTEVAFTFTSANIPTGNTFSEGPRFDSTGLGNFALPTFDWQNPIVDHDTGLKVYPITGPAQATFGKYVLTTSLATTANPATVDGEKLQGTNWSCSPIPTCTYSTAAQDPLMIRLAGTLGTTDDGRVYSWNTILALETGFHNLNVDSLQLALTGDGGGSSIPIEVALTWNGVTAGTEWVPLTLDPASSTKQYPAALSSLLAAWQGPNVQLVPGMAFTQAEMRMHVDTSGTSVTANGGDFSVFQTDSRLIVAGSKITINSVEYTIASVDSSTHLTLTGSAGSQTNTLASVFNFGFLVRKASASAGTIHLTGATVTMALSQSFSNGGSGFQVLCSPQTSTDSGGVVGRFCIFGGYEPAIYWVTNDYKGRYIGRALMPASSLGVPADEYGSAFYAGQSIFDSTDANSWYASTSLNSNGHPTLVKITYNPAGGNCPTSDGRMVPGDYQRFPLQADWTNGMDNCHITYTELTKPTDGNDIYTQLVPNLKNGKFGLPGFSFIQGDKAVFTATPGGTDIEAWYIHVSLTTKRVTGQFSTYMNASPLNPRFCGSHAPLPSNQTDGWYSVLNHDVGEQGVSGGVVSGDGPNHLIVSNAINDTTDVGSCSGITDPAVSRWVPFAAGCSTITVTSSDNIPCDPDPSTWETANMPACTIPGHSSWRQYEGGAAKVGDFFIDPVTGFELMILAHHTSGSTWVALRNVSIPHGVLLQDAVGPGYIRSHSANWLASFICSQPSNSFVNVAEVDGSGVVWDQRFMGFNHTVLRHDGTASVDDASDAFGDPSELSVRTGNYPGVLGLPETYRMLLNAPFAGQGGVSNHNQLLQSHPGWRTGDTFITDFSPFAPKSGGVFYLGSTTVTNPSGQLYKLAASQTIVPINKRARPQVTWSGMYNLKDVSGTGIDGTSGHSYQYCTVDYLPGGGCGQGGESLGDVFINMPQAVNDSRMGITFDYNHIQSFPLAMEAMSAVQYFFDSSILSFSGMNVNTARTFRRLTSAFGRPDSQDTYSNIKGLEGGDLAILTGTALNMQRNVDILAVPLLPKPATEVGNTFMTIPVAVGTAAFAEVQFGYAENGAVGSFFCTTRPESCMTSTDGTVPFKWEGERSGTTNVKTCSGGCTINLPVQPDHSIYFRSRTSPDGTTWSNGPLQVAMATVPGPSGCSDLSLAPTSHSSPAAGDSGSITVTVTDQTCAWTATSGAGWTTTSASGTGNGTAGYTVASNSGAIRSTNITISGQVFTVTQAAPPANFVGPNIRNTQMRNVVVR